MQMNARTMGRILGIAVCILIVLRLLSFVLEGEEGRLKRTIYKAKRAIEREDIVRLPAYISIQYNDDYGNDRRSLLAVAKSFFDEFKDIIILIDSLDITINGEDAKVRIKATVYWKENSSEQVVYETTDVRAHFRKKERQWKLIKLEFLEPEQRRHFNPLIG